VSQKNLLGEIQNPQETELSWITSEQSKTNGVLIMRGFQVKELGIIIRDNIRAMS
jgi:hypothetical protein